MILSERGAVLPDVLPSGTPFSEKWRVISDSCTTFEAQLKQVGWTLFFMAGEIHTIAFGFDLEKRLNAAVGRALHQVESEHCNCVEITGVGVKSFLGIPYSTVTAHARHIQSGSRFRGQ